MTTLKKSISTLLISGLVAATLVGCGGGNDTANDTAKGNTDTKTEAKGSLAKIKERGTLYAGVKYDTNLFGLKDPATGKVEGFDIDIAKAIAKEILGDENKIELKEVTSQTRIPMLEKGDIDMIIATMTITEERKKQVNFSDVYFKAGQSLLVKKGSDIKGVDSLKGKKVIAVKGSTSAKNIRSKAPDAEVIELGNYAEAFTALKGGKGDALTTDNSILIGMTKQDSSYELVGGLFTDEPYGIAIKKGDDELTTKVNEILKKLQDNGEYDKIYKKWIGEPVK